MVAMRKLLVAAFIALVVSGTAYADVWDDDSYSDEWSSPAQEDSQPEPAVEPEPSPEPQPVAESAPELSSELIYESETVAGPTPEPKAEEPLPQVESDHQVAATEAAQSVAEEPKDKPSGGSKIHWIPLSISAAVGVAGGVLAYWFDSKAKKATDNIPANKEEYKVNRDNAGKYQTCRAISIGVAAAGLVGVGLSILF